VIGKPFDASACVGMSCVDGPAGATAAWSVAEGLGLRRIVEQASPGWPGDACWAAENRAHSAWTGHWCPESMIRHQHWVVLVPLSLSDDKQGWTRRRSAAHDH
jgi:hypothetical protein